MQESPFLTGKLVVPRKVSFRPVAGRKLFYFQEDAMNGLLGLILKILGLAIAAAGMLVVYLAPVGKVGEATHFQEVSK